MTQGCPPQKHPTRNRFRQGAGERVRPAEGHKQGQPSIIRARSALLSGQDISAHPSCQPRELVSAIDHTAIGITLDTSHANVAGLDIPQATGDFGELLVGTHISDNEGSGDQHLTPSIVAERLLKLYG